MAAPGIHAKVVASDTEQEVGKHCLVGKAVEMSQDWLALVVAHDTEVGLQTSEVGVYGLEEVVHVPDVGSHNPVLQSHNPALGKHSPEVSRSGLELRLNNHEMGNHTSAEVGHGHELKVHTPVVRGHPAVKSQDAEMGGHPGECAQVAGGHGECALILDVGQEQGNQNTEAPCLQMELLSVFHPHRSIHSAECLQQKLIQVKGKRQKQFRRLCSCVG